VQAGVLGDVLSLHLSRSVIFARNVIRRSRLSRGQKLAWPQRTADYSTAPLPIQRLVFD